MANDGATVERLRQFLRELKPDARAMLIAELERAMLRGDAVNGGDLILQELRQIINESRGMTPRLSGAVRLFYKPVEPFVVDDMADHNHPNRIARAALTPIWNWIAREVLPSEARQFADEANDALISSETPAFAALTRNFQDQVAKEISRLFDEVRGDEKAERRLRSQIGTPQAEEGALLVARVFENREVLEEFMLRLPLQLGDLSGLLLDEIRSRIDTQTTRNAALFPYFIILVMSRLTERWQIIRLAIKAAGSDHATRVAATSYSVAVNMTLAELARMVAELKNNLRSGRGVACGILLKHIHDFARGLRTELDLPAESNWGRQLAAQRAQISNLLKSEIESTPGRVRRLLRPRAATDIRPGVTLDRDDVLEAEALVEFVGTCRGFASELAINEMTQRSYSELQHYLDNNTRILIDGLRHAGDTDRPFRLSQVDAAIRFCGKVFGADYAAMMAKSADAAGQGEPVQASG